MMMQSVAFRLRGAARALPACLSMSMRRGLNVVAATMLAATGAAADGLGDEPEVVNGLISLGAADIIRRECPEIAPRWIAAWRFLKSLEARARAAGYSEAEIESYVKDDTEKARLKGIARRYLREEGVVSGEPSSYCAVGRDHIARETRIGLLLKTR